MTSVSNDDPAQHFDNNKSFDNNLAPQGSHPKGTAGNPLKDMELNKEKSFRSASEGGQESPFLPKDNASDKRDLSLARKNNSEEALRRLEEEGAVAKVQLAWEQKQAEEAIGDVYASIREIGPALEEAELAAKVAQRLRELPEMPPMMRELGAKEKEIAKQRRHETLNNARAWHEEMFSSSALSSAMRDAEFDQQAALLIHDETYRKAVETRKEAILSYKTLDERAQTEKTVESEAAKKEGGAAAHSAWLSIQTEFENMMAKGGADAWFVWQREALKDQFKSTTHKILIWDQPGQNDSDRKEMEADLRQSGIDPDALYRSRTKDLAERADKKERRYRPPFFQAIRPSVRRKANAYIQARDQFNQQLDQAADLHDRLSDPARLRDEAAQEHARLMTEAVQKDAPTAGRRISFETPELQQKYEDAVQELVLLHDKMNLPVLRMSENYPAWQQAEERLSRLTVAKLPNLPGLRQQALADAQAQFKKQ